MSVSQCTSCHAPVDTDADKDAYATSRCRCAVCRDALNIEEITAAAINMDLALRDNVGGVAMNLITSRFDAVCGANGITKNEARVIAGAGGTL